MFLRSFAKILVLLVILPADILTNEDEFSRKDDKVILSPSELVDMVWEEQMRGIDSPEHDQIQKNTIITDQGDTSPENIASDEERLKSRKVWSRWSKWSKCSVTCGAGSLTRRRLCVSGRCAPGEREEQHRACARAPCDHRAPLASTPPADDLHDDAE